MKNLTTSLTAKQKESFRSPYIRLTFSLAGQTTVVIEQDRILDLPSQEETDDSQTAEVVFQNSDGYFTSLDFKGWQVVMEWGLSTTAGIEYSALPPMKVMDQDMVSARGVLRCTMKFVGIPDLLATDKASTDYLHHWSDTKTVKTLIGEIASRGGTLTNLTGTVTGSPVNLVAGTNTITVTVQGTFTIVLPAGSKGRAISGTATVTSSPVALVGGSQVITVTGTGTITIMAVDTELTESQESSAGELKLDNTRDGAGVFLSVDSRTITKISFRLKRTTLYAARNVTFKIDSVSAGSLASGTFAVGSIGTDYAWCEVTLATPLLVDEDIVIDEDGVPTYGIWIYVIDLAGLKSATDYVTVSICTTDLKPNERLLEVLAGGSPTYPVNSDGDSEDCAYRYKYQATGVSVFSHCTSYDVVFDSEDSLIDTYAPADGFRIDEGSSRLDAINKLLQFTGCVKLVKADGKIHVLVPTTSIVNVDVGSAATNRNYFLGGLTTYIDLANPVNVNGFLTSIEIWAATTITGMRIGAFYLVSGTTYKCRNSVIIGTVTAGSKQTFSVSLPIVIGDFIGCYFDTGSIEASQTGGTGLAYIESEQIDPDDSAVYEEDAGYAISLYGTGYNYYEYALGSGNHEFFSKSVRNALVVPNKITVHSFPDDDTIYTGYDTDSVSYALVPKEDFIRAKLTSSAQGTAIATARIGQLQMASQRGSATVPMNLGAEIWDFVKVTDSRQSDSRTGNLGYIKRWYTPGRDLNMGFSFGKLEITGIGVSRVHVAPRPLRVKEKYVLAEDYYIEQDERDTFNEKTADTLEKWVTPNLRNLMRKDFAKSDEDPTDTQIASALIGYLQHLVEDTVPKLGGDLDLNGKNIDFPTTPNISDCLDEDSMSSNSATKLATQQSIKAYVDAHTHSGITLAQSDVTASRALGSTYRNTSGKSLIVTVTVALPLNDTSIGVVVYCDSNASPATEVGRFRNGGGSVTFDNGSITFVVPNLDYYKAINSDYGTPTIIKWIEWS